MKQQAFNLVWLYLHNYSAINLTDGLMCTLIICIIYSFWLTFDPIVTLFCFMFTILGAVFVQLYFSCFSIRSLRDVTDIQNQPTDTNNCEMSPPTDSPDMVSNKESHTVSSDADSLGKTLNYASFVLTNNFIASWYGSVSDSTDFIEHVSPLILIALQNVCKRTQSIQVSKLIPLVLEDGLVKFLQSVEESVHLTINSSNKDNFAEDLLKNVLLEKTFTSFEASKFAHNALRYKNSLHKYIENIFDILFLASGLSFKAKQSDVFHYFLRDVLSTNIFERIISVFSQPHVLFHLINLIIDDLMQTISIVESPNVKKTARLSVSYNFCDYSPDYSTHDNYFSDKPIYTIPNSRGLYKESNQLDDKFIEFNLHKQATRPVNTSNSSYKTYHSRALKGVTSHSESKLVETESIKITHFDLISSQPGLPYYVYYIQIQISFIQRYVNDCNFTQDTIPRRFREFAQLHQILKSKYRSYYKGITFPSKFALFANMSKELLLKRKLLLQQYLQSLCTRDKLVKSPEFQDFLGLGSGANSSLDESYKGQLYMGRQLDQEIALTFEDIDLKFSLFITGCLDPNYDFLLNSSSTTISKLDSDIDSEQNSGNFSTGLPDETHSNRNSLANTHEFSLPDDNICSPNLYQQNIRMLYEMLKSNKTDCALLINHYIKLFPLSTALYKFGVTVLRNKLLWVNREAFFIFMLSHIGEDNEEHLRNKLHSILEEDNLKILIQVLLQKYFPDGVFSCYLLQTPSPTDSLSLKLLKSKTCDKIFNFIPDSVKKLVGEGEIRIAIQSFLDCLSNEKINSHLILKLLDIFIKTLLPEIDPQLFESFKI